MLNYKIDYVNGDFEFEQRIEQRIGIANIDNFLWMDNDYRPLSYAIVCHDRQKLHVFLTSHEANPRALETRPNGDVYKDSCLEFFFMPAPELSNVYLNFEFNPIGVAYFASRTSRYDKTFHPEVDAAIFNIRANILSDRWEIRFVLPFKFLSAFGFKYEPEVKLKGNFYKCGDMTEIPHYGCWSKIDAPTPDFHRPEYFSQLILI